MTPRRTTVCLLSVVAMTVAACASTELYDIVAHGTYEDGFRAVAQTLPKLDWFVTSSDTDTGLITATRGIVGGRTTDRQLRLTLAVRGQGDGLVIEATFVPPGMAFGTARGERGELVNALRSRLPDAHVVGE